MESGPLACVDSQRRDDFGDLVVAEVDFPPVGAGVSAGFNDAVMVRAQQNQVPQGCQATGPPRHDTVRMARLRRLVTTRENTPTVTDFESSPDRGGHQPLRTAHIQNLRRAAQHRRQQVGITQQPAGHRRRQRFPRTHQPGIHTPLQHGNPPAPTPSTRRTARHQSAPATGHRSGHQEQPKR